MENKPTQSKKIRKGDRVVAIAGNNKGQIGTVQSRKGENVIVQGLNLRKKHVKKSQEAPKGRIIEIERPIHISNLKVCVEGDTAAKLKVRINEHGDRQFIYKKDDQEVVYRSLKKPK
jgi:large subunit ribosomal protein L24